jgi:glycosyltransferase involved in cell wall biosynthesis
MLATVHTDPSATFYRECERIVFSLLVFFHRIVLIGISKYNAELIKKRWRLNDNIVKYVNNGIDLNGYYKKPHEKFTFTNVSRQDKNKNQSLILRAFARLCSDTSKGSVKLFLVGGGETHKTLRNEAVRLGIKEFVEFTGYIDNVKEHLALSDVYISSSHREGFPLSVIEAMASGLPVIATDAGGVRDLVRNNGILIADDDEEGLLTAMKELKNNEELRSSMGMKSIEMAREYSSYEMAMKYTCLYDEIFDKA